MVGQSSPIRNGKLRLQLFICTNIVANESKIESPNMKLVSGATLVFKPLVRVYRKTSGLGTTCTIHPYKFQNITYVT
jgi:hypothetical protein